MTRRLPTPLQVSFFGFLADVGLEPTQATAAIKIRWLLAEIKERKPAMGWKTFMQYVRALESFGPQDETEREEQALVVREFAQELRNKRLFKPERATWAMPKDVFKLLINDAMGDSPEHGLIRARLRAQLKLVWSSGLRFQELLSMRRNWLERSRDGFVLQVDSEHAWARRRILIPELKDTALCAVRELDFWLEILPPDPMYTMFPDTNGRGTFRGGDSPFRRNSLNSGIEYRLRMLGYPEYNYTSIRISFFQRCREQLGELPAFSLSGLRDYKGFRELMRSQTDFVSFPLARGN